ncbi:hypothetical protein BDW69DRAFT_116619 [Aspergillus filifer]
MFHNSRHLERITLLKLCLALDAESPGEKEPAERYYFCSEHGTSSLQTTQPGTQHLDRPLYSTFMNSQWLLQGEAVGTARLSLMLAENLRLESPYRVPSSLNKEGCPLCWRPVPVEEPPYTSGLPSVDDLYVSNTVSSSSWSQDAHSILDEMVSKGKLFHLESLFR